MWLRTAKSLEKGTGIPEGLKLYKNIYGNPLMSPEQLNGFRLDPTTSIVTAGFVLFGPGWPHVYHTIRVPAKRGDKLKPLPDNIRKGFIRLEEEYGEDGEGAE